MLKKLTILFFLSVFPINLFAAFWWTMLEDDEADIVYVNNKKPITQSEIKVKEGEKSGVFTIKIVREKKEDKDRSTIPNDDKTTNDQPMGGQSGLDKTEKEPEFDMTNVKNTEALWSKDLKKSEKPLEEDSAIAKHLRDQPLKPKKEVRHIEEKKINIDVNPNITSKISKYVRVNCFKERCIHGVSQSDLNAYFVYAISSILSNKEEEVINTDPASYKTLSMFKIKHDLKERYEIYIADIINFKNKIQTIVDVKKEGRVLMRVTVEGEVEKVKGIYGFIQDLIVKRVTITEKKI